MTRVNVNLDELEYAGSFAVDSGQAMIGDPCYINNWDTNQGDEWKPENHAGEYSYQGACQATLTNDYGTLGNSSAVAVSTGYGDGLYPVYVKRNGDGRIAYVIIDFEGDFDNDN